MALAALALDSLSDAVSDESILHFIATLDTEADLQLIIRTGRVIAGMVTTGLAPPQGAAFDPSAHQESVYKGLLCMQGN